MVLNRASNSFLGNIASWVFVLLCFGYPMPAILSVFLGVPSTPINIIYRSICLALSLGVIVFLLLSNQQKISKASMPLLLFLFIYLFRIIWDTTIVKVKLNYGLLEVYSFYIGCIIIPIVTVLLSFKYINLKKTVLRIFYILCIDNILLLFCYLSQNGWIISPKLLLSRAVIFFGNAEVVNSIGYGIYGACLLLFCSCVLLNYKNEFSKKILWAIRFFLVLGFTNLIISSSRGPILFSITTLMILFTIHHIKVRKTSKYYSKILSLLLIITAITAISAVYLNVNNIQIGIFSRFNEMKENVRLGKSEERVELFSEAFSMFKSSPIIGKRFVTESIAYGGSYPHNVFLEVLMSLGLVGMFLYLIILYYLYKTILAKKDSKFFMIFICLFIFFFGMTQVSGSLFYSVENWNLMAALFAISNENYIRIVQS